MRLVSFVIVLAACLVSLEAATSCQQLVSDLISSLLEFNITKLPLNSVLYSGFTTNNPGQKDECEHEKYAYYLLALNNQTSGLKTYTGICVPQQCTRDEIQQVLSFLDCQVYDFPVTDGSPYLYYSGLSMSAIWLIFILFRSCRRFVKSTNGSLSVRKIGDQSVSNYITPPPQLQSLMTEENIEERPRAQPKPYFQNHLIPVNVLSAFLLGVSVELSYKQQISVNINQALQFWNAPWGFFVCNIDLCASTLVFVVGFRLACSVFKQKELHRFYFRQLIIRWLLLIVMSLILYTLGTCIQDPFGKVWRKSNTDSCSEVMWKVWSLVRAVSGSDLNCLPGLWLLEAELVLLLFSIPFIVVFRRMKRVGYGLLGLLVTLATLLGYRLLVKEGVNFQPSRLLNQQVNYSLDYQLSVVGRSCSFFIGLMFGLFLQEGCEGTEPTRKGFEHQLYFKLKKSRVGQIVLHLIGISLCILAFISIIYFLPPPADLTPYDDRTILFILFSPIVFQLGVCLFCLPFYWGGTSWVTQQLQKASETQLMQTWNKIARMLVIGCPAILGFLTFSLQFGIYYDLWTVITYLFGCYVILFYVSWMLEAIFERRIARLALKMENLSFPKKGKFVML